MILALKTPQALIKLPVFEKPAFILVLSYVRIQGYLWEIIVVASKVKYERIFSLFLGILFDPSKKIIEVGDVVLKELQREPF